YSRRLACARASLLRQDRLARTGRASPRDTNARGYRRRASHVLATARDRVATRSPRSSACSPLRRVSFHGVMIGATAPSRGWYRPRTLRTNQVWRWHAHTDTEFEWVE